MKKLIADDLLRKQLNGAEQPLEICDQEGNTLGHFVPPAIYRLLWDALKYPPDLTDEELERRFAQGPGKPLAQIWKELGRV